MLAIFWLQKRHEREGGHWWNDGVVYYKERLYRHSHRSVCHKMQRSNQRPTIISNDVITIIEIRNNLRHRGDFKLTNFGTFLYGVRWVRVHLYKHSNQMSVGQADRFSFGKIQRTGHKLVPAFEMLMKWQHKQHLRKNKNRSENRIEGWKSKSKSNRTNHNRPSPTVLYCLVYF